MATAITFSGISFDTTASNAKVTSVLPTAGFSYVLSSSKVSLSTIKTVVESKNTTEDVKTTETSNTGFTTSVGFSTLTASTTGVKAATATTETSEEATESDSSVATSTDTTEETVTSEETTTTEATTKDITETIEDITEASTDSSSEEADWDVVTEEMAAEAAAAEEESFKSLVIAQVNNYVNVRDSASEDGEVVGKLYNNSVGTLIEEENGWYKITSGSVTGYVKAEYCVTGEDAVELAKEVGTRIATVTTTTLKVRADASTDAEVLGLVPIEDELIVVEELDGWVKVSIEEGEGYVSTDYVMLSTEFVTAESKEEEEARLAQEAAEKAAAYESLNSKQSSSSESSDSSYTSAVEYTTETSSIGAAVAAFAQQFVGNPYVYGGTSLTNGADCSGFVMSVYANFGVSLPHSSGADRTVGSAVDGLENAQPGDIICYSGHVAIYIGNGQIVHASTAKTGIKISNADYRTILAIRRIF
ncbi:MAG: SH3 domain-containing protein [Butyrivibrio sp.]|nr:SH3 domain-containing protein [Butyrivibrio sp.]